jgi:pyruvate kinase
MLESMISNPMPTRAEVTDVANAVFEQADAIMLSGETTVGKYPVQCVEVFDRIAQRIERSGGAGFQSLAENLNQRQKLVKTAVFMADELQADAIIVFTVVGHLARYAGWMRPQISPIYAICATQEIANELTLTYAVTSLVLPFNQGDFRENENLAIKMLVEKKLLSKGNTVVIITSVMVSNTVADAVQMRKV